MSVTKTQNTARETISLFLSKEQERLNSGEATPPFQRIQGNLVINWLRARAAHYGNEEGESS